MPLFKDEISKDIKQMEDEMEKVFRHLSTFRNYFFPSPLHKPWHPYTDVYETQTDLIIKVELAGVRKEDVKIFTEEDKLIIHGIRRETCPEGKIAYRQMEINYGPFEAIIPLIIPIDEKKPINSTIINGILEVKLPKAKEGKIHHIKIRIIEEE
jgi:HSP20 family protein